MSDCPKCPPQGAPEWMVTYGDLMTLLLCFFVLLFSFSSLETKKFESLKESMKGAFGVLKGESTTLGRAKSKTPPKATDKTFDQAASRVMAKVNATKIPKEKLELLHHAILKAMDALRLISVERDQVEKIVRELEKPESFVDEESMQVATIPKVAADPHLPKNHPTEEREMSGGTEQRKAHSESAQRALEPPRSKGESQETERSDNSMVDISQGRDQNMQENTGQQKDRDMQSGQAKPKPRHHDKEKYRSEDKDNDFRVKPDIKTTMDEFTTLSGMVEMTSQDLSHAVFHFPQDLLFEKGSLELREQAKEYVYKIFMENYQKNPNAFFQIEAHTDFSDVTEDRDLSWDTGIKRAQSVLEYLLLENEEFDPKRFCIVSFGAYQPKYRYLPGQKELEQNRRLEVRMFVKP